MNHCPHYSAIIPKEDCPPCFGKPFWGDCINPCPHCEADSRLVCDNVCDTFDLVRELRKLTGSEKIGLEMVFDGHYRIKVSCEDHYVSVTISEYELMMTDFNLKTEILNIIYAKFKEKINEKEKR